LPDQDHDHVRAWLNVCELIAVGVNYDAFSEIVSEAYWGDVIPKTYQTAKGFIDEVRKGDGSSLSYKDLEDLAKKWASKPSPA
jgi:hypothetical protein